MDDQSAQRGRGRGRGRGQQGRGGRGGLGSQGGDDPSSRQDATSLPADSSSSSSSRPKIINGSYHCDYHKKSGKCDVCKHMEEKRNVLSSHFNIPHSIAGHNTHLPATQKPKLKWFIYLEECIHPEGIYQYVGSTDSMTHRWANTKSKINAITAGKDVKPGTGLTKHVKKGCSVFTQGMNNVRITLLEHFTTSTESLEQSSHQEGPGCRCCECNKLKDLEDKWISRLGTYHGQFSLNDRDEITRKTRVNY